MPAVLAARDSIEPAVGIARRFAQFRSLPEHPLFISIHAQLASGDSPYRVAHWVQRTVPPDDPLGSDTIETKSLERKLSRYRKLLPASSLLPSSHLDGLVKRVSIHVDVMQELGALICYQRQRLSLFAERERDLPMGTLEQQRREVMTLAHLLEQMRDTQLVLGILPRTSSGSLMTSHAGTDARGVSTDAADPMNRILSDDPDAMSRLIARLDEAFGECGSASEPAVICSE